MTTPHERTRSVIQTSLFLEALCARDHAADVSEEVPREALRLLRHYPDEVHVNHAAIAWSEMWSHPRLRLSSNRPSYIELIAQLRELTRNTLASAEGRSEPLVERKRDDDA